METPVTRHLLYHLLPVRGNGRWQWNVGKFRAWLPLFDGRKIVAVMTEGKREYTANGPAPDGARVPLELDQPEEVEAAFEGYPGVEFVRIANDPNLREVVSHGPLFGRLADTFQPGDVALWAHAKGTTRHAG